jgi:hypothetical protein
LHRVFGCAFTSIAQIIEEDAFGVAHAVDLLLFLNPQFR